MTHTIPWLSIVTAIKNDTAGLQQTLESLERLDLSDVEWIVVDSSDDATEVADLLSDVPITPDVYWIAPSGVFEAMNFGLEHATGYYTYFLNAGDELLPGALDAVRAAATSSDPAWIVTPVVLHELSGAITVTQKLDFPQEQKAFFSRGRFANHQGTFVRTGLLRQLGGFTPGYVVAADYEMFL